MVAQWIERWSTGRSGEQEELAMKPNRRSNRWRAMGRCVAVAVTMLAGASASHVSAAVESLCAEVEIDIIQPLTLERQAFDAHMRINNQLTHLSLENVAVEVQFMDRDGYPVTATSDPGVTNALFFITEDELTNIDNVTGTGSIGTSTSADIHWLIIPAPGAAVSPNGTVYQVGATLSYTMGGEPFVMKVAPDSVTVKPMPELVLDYFLPDNVHADDPLTLPIEPAVPFNLGVRILNGGIGPAVNVRTDSGQPRIIRNDLGLLISYAVTGSFVDEQAATKSLLINFGNIGPAEARCGRWVMETSLSGTFTAFDASFTHSDELGGELTSLIDEVRTHTLVHDVLCDQSGRDAVRDFLARDGVSYHIYESDAVDAPVPDQSSVALLSIEGQATDSVVYRLTVPAATGPFYAGKLLALPVEHGVTSVVRGDGKVLPDANAWISKAREDGSDPWEYTLNVFDTGVGGTYTVSAARLAPPELPPVLHPIGDKVVMAGAPLGVGFLVIASDPDALVPLLESTELPYGASFSVATNGILAEGTFLWNPVVGQQGVYPVRFTATDPQGSDSERIRIYVGSEGEPLGTGGVPDSLAMWDPDMTNLIASSGVPSAQVLWDGAGGIAYDIYRSWDDFAVSNMTWELVATGVVAQTQAASWTDPGLGTTTTQAYYKVVLSGDPTNEQRVWGVLRDTLPASAESIFAPPLRGARELGGVLGTALADAWLGAEDGPGGEGSELYLLKPDGSWRVLYLDGSGRWRDEDGTLTDAELAAGHAAVAIGAGGGTATFTGEVGNDGQTRVNVWPGWNLLAPSAGRVVKLKEFLAGASAAPTGGTLEAMGDQLIYWDASQVRHWLMLADDSGGGWDGNWVDLNTFETVDPVFKPGQGVYYYHASTNAVEVAQ